MKNRNHYFKVKPGDDARLFAEIDIETEGFIARLRRIAHDREPYAFLVDLQRRPYDAKKIADIVHLSNNRATIVIAESHAARLIESAAQFRAALVDAPGASKKAKAKLQCFEALCRELPDDVPLATVYVMPTLLDDFIESEVNKNIGKGGGNPSLVKFPEGLTPRLTTGLTSELTGVVKAQISESKSESESKSNSESTSYPERERETSTARGRGERGDERPMTMRAYTARAHEISLWQKRLAPMSEEAFSAAFEAEFHMAYPTWCAIRREMEASIEESTPSTCRDGHHVFDGAYCRYCPFIRVDEEIA